VKTSDYIALSIAAVIISSVLLVSGLTLFDLVNNPVDNLIGGVHCKIESYTPPREGEVKVGSYTGKTDLPEKVVIRLDDGTVVETANGAVGTCRVGQDAEAAIRVGQITGKLIKAVFVACYER
jgi:hypothetical protein